MPEEEVPRRPVPRPRRDDEKAIGLEVAKLFGLPPRLLVSPKPPPVKTPADTAVGGSVTVDGLRIAYREAGAGPVVLLLHGWPTSSFLWRNVMGPLARRHRVVAIDLPGYGDSDKPLRRYDAAFFDSVLDGFLAALGIGDVALAVHDLGGPVGLHWAAGRPDRIWALALLNTLVYPELHEEVADFARGLIDRHRRVEMTSDRFLADAMRLGIADHSRVTPELVAGVTAPFRTDDDRQALARAGCGIRRPELARIAEWLPSVAVPVRVIYGVQDRALPDVADTMARVAADVPHAEITPLPDCGHYLQEDQPEVVGKLLATFFDGVR
jgi:pimeloyl-ACP methyl ester carboxylesterase